MSYTVFSEKLQAIKCDRGEVYLWNPRLYYEKVLCPLCPGNPQKEITTPHFRKHLEQVHTIEGMILRLELLFSLFATKNVASQKLVKWSASFQWSEPQNL